MSSVFELHEEIVKQLEARGEEVWRPKGLKHWKDKNPIVYNKRWSGVFVCGHALKEPNGTYTLHSDFFSYVYTGFKFEDLGLCDAYLWYQREKVEELYSNRIIEVILATREDGSRVKITVERD